MPVSKMDNDISCDVAAIVTTSQLPPNCDKGGAFPSNVNSHGKTSVPFLIDGSSNHSNYTEEKSQVCSERQRILGESVDQDHHNKICSSGLDLKNALLSPKAIQNQNAAPPNENSCLSTNNSMTLNDGKESIELMVNSLSSVGNHEEVQMNNNGRISLLSGKEHETDTSFIKLNEKVRYDEAPSTDIPQNLEIDNRRIIEKSQSTNKEASSSTNKSKYEPKSIPDSDSFHDINKIDATHTRRSSSQSNQSISSLNSNKGNITKPLLDSSESIIKKEPVSQEDSRFECLQQMERIHGECCFKIAIEGARGKNEERRWRQHNTAEKYGSFRSSRKKTNVKKASLLRLIILSF